MRPIHFLILIFILCLLPIILGLESILLSVLPGGLPLGTFLAATALIAGALIPVIQGRSGKVLWRMGIILVIAAILWLPLGIILSGNAALNFVQDAVDSTFFWRFTSVLAGLIILELVWTSIQTFLLPRD